MPLSTVQDLGFDLSTSQEDQNLLVQIDPARARLRGDELEAAFEQLWQIYPNGKEKKNALIEFLKLKPTREFCTTLQQSIYAHRQTHEWHRDGGRYVPRLVNFLKKRAWEDRVDTPAPTVSERTLRNVGAARAFMERDDDEEADGQ